jgi:two-component system, sensor histidine kinase RpfC
MKRVAERLAAMRQALAGRPDTEHEQAIVRVLVVAVLCGYLAPEAFAGSDLATIQVMFAYLAISVVLFLLILASPGASPSRRVAAMVADNFVVTWCMAFLGEHAAPLLLVYVWITLANGFRFGQRYLLMSLGFSVAGMLFVIATSEFWQHHKVVGYGLLFGMVALSLYVRSLVKKLFEAISRAEAANQAKRRFISVVSHELRTPLNAIIGMADLLRDTPLNREQADMLQTLRSSSRMMLGLVEDVLDFSKIEAGKVVLDKTEFDLHALVNSTCRILSAQAAGKGIEFVVSIMPEVPPALRGDPHYLRQVLVNLAGNAVKFTEKGSVTVHVSAQGETESGVRLKFSIRDTGIGIPPEAQSRIFESFAQADQSTTRRFGGTGLGTTIAQQLVGLMGGRIGLESAVGLGSTFWFEIPLEKQPERPLAAPGELAGGCGHSPAGEPRRSGRRASRKAPRASSRRSAWRGPITAPFYTARGKSARRPNGCAARRRIPRRPRCWSFRRAPMRRVLKRFPPDSPRSSSCRSTSAACSTCCIRSARARRRGKAWCGCRTTPAGARRGSCARWLRTTTRPTAR